MNRRVGAVLLVALAAASGCTKQTASSSTPSTAAAPESTLIQESAAQLPAEPSAQLVLPAEPMPAPAAAPAAPMETAAAPAGAAAPIGSAQDIQRALQQAGFYQGAIDGKIGPKTLQAIKEFQQAHQLKVDGKVGPRTWAALQPYLGSSSNQ